MLQKVFLATAALREANGGGDGAICGLSPLLGRERPLPLQERMATFKQAA
jgi:hypothetical protein